MSQPNVLLIHCHDLGRFTGSYGVSTVQTPNLDQLAATGVKFDQAFATAPPCSPSRASLFTDRYPHNTGVMGLTQDDFAFDLYPDERHLAQYFQDAGYRTALVGVHHESRTPLPADEIGQRLGFDISIPDSAMEEPCRAEAVTRLGLQQLDALADADRPFYLQLGYVEPHRLPTTGQINHMGFLGDYITPDDEFGVTVPPYLVDDPGTRLEMAELQGAVRHLDQSVGQVLDRVRELGIEDHTLVVFTTEHGLALPRAKCTLYDPGLEITLLVRYPGAGWVGGRTSDQMVSNIDILPTILDAAGITTSTNIHGHSLRGLLEGGDVGARDRIFAEMTYHNYYDPRRCIRTAKYKAIANFSSAPAFVDPSQSWRPRSQPRVGLGEFHPPVELYDLTVDPAESFDLANDPAYRNVRAVLLEQLYSWMVNTDDPVLDGAVTGPLHRRTLAALNQSTREAVS